MKDPNLEALDFKIIQLEKEYCIYKTEIIKEQSLISRHLQSLYPNTEAIHERNVLINELEKAMKDAERNIGKYKREREKICRKRINILKKAIERLENEYQDHLMRQEQERESLEKATGDEHLFKHRKAVLQETESVIIAVQNELTKYKEELKNLKIVKDMDDECFA